MKHFLFILAFFAAFCSFRSVAAVEEASSAQPSQQFLNPIFNERMIAISSPSNGWDILLTPTQIINTKKVESKTLSDVENCRLIGQTQTRVLMECLNNKQQPYYELFVSIGKAEDSMDCQYCHIVQVHYSQKMDLNDPHPVTSEGYLPYHVLNDNCGPVEKDPRPRSRKK